MAYTPPAGNAVDLVFSGSYAPPAANAVELNFNAVNGAELSISASLGGLSASLLIGNFPTVEVAVSLGGLSGDVQLAWTAGVYRGLETSRASGFDSKRSFVDYQRLAAHLQAAEKSANRVIGYVDSHPLHDERGGFWADVPKKRSESLQSWQQVASKNKVDTFIYRAAPSKRREQAAFWQPPGHASLALGGHYLSPPQRMLQDIVDSSTASGRCASVAALFEVAASRFLQHASLVWGDGNPHSWIWGGWTYPPVPPTPLYVPSTELQFYQVAEDYTGGAILVHGNPCYAWPLSGKPTQQINGVYIVLHAITVKRLPDMVNISTESATLQFDIDSWCWSLSLNLRTSAAMALLEPVNGEPREVRIELDGNYITGIIESYGERRIFGETTYVASGRSSLALMASPFAPVRSRLETTQQTAAQLIDFELLNTGWTAAYHNSLVQLFTTDWLVPGGAWSYQNKSPIEAIIQVAKASGARAFADKTASLVHIHPRYPVSPWDWATATVDKTLPLSLARSINTRLAPQPTYNHVYVSGVNQGVLVSATRNGTAGDVPAPMVTDALITYVDAGRERARNILADVGRQSRVTLDFPLNAITGLIEPGQLVEVSDAIAWRGLVVATSINAEYGAISQQIEVERHY